jgi:hypothetical protein
LEPQNIHLKLNRLYLPLVFDLIARRRHWDNSGIRTAAISLRIPTPQIWLTGRNPGVQRSGQDCANIVSPPFPVAEIACVPPCDEFDHNTPLSALGLSHSFHTQFPRQHLPAHVPHQLPKHRNRNRKIPRGHLQRRRNFPRKSMVPPPLFPRGLIRRFLCTSAAAEIVYLTAIDAFTNQSLLADPLSLPFYQRFLPSISPGQYSFNSTEFNAVVSGMITFGDSFLSTVQQHSFQNGSISEEFDRFIDHLRGLMWCVGTRDIVLVRGI